MKMLYSKTMRLSKATFLWICLVQALVGIRSYSTLHWKSKISCYVDCGFGKYLNETIPIIAVHNIYE